MTQDITTRLLAAASVVEIQQLAVRYAHALDARDLEGLSDLWVSDVWMGKAHGEGPAAVRSYFEPVLRKFYRSIHMIVGHRVDLVDAEHATGQVYCRAEHESGDAWVVQAIAYEDDYRLQDGRWLFARRKHHHWYSTPIDRAPTPPSFEDWAALGGPLPDLPHHWPTWTAYWDKAPDARRATTRAPGAPAGPCATPSLRSEEKDEIFKVAALYGILIDDRDWPGLDRVFTEDAVFVIAPRRDRPEVRVEGLAAIRDFMHGSTHPVAHHVTNIAVEGGPDDATLRSKIVGTLPKARAGSADYRDKLRRTPDGWRIAERIVTIRVPEGTTPAGSAD